MALSRRMVLVVDDDSKIREAFRALFRAHHVECEVAASADEAFAVVDREQPSLALVDGNMPEVDGFELCELFQKDLRTKAMPVIMVTGLIDPLSLKRGLEAGAVDYVKKPFSPSEIVARVLTHLRLADARAEERLAQERLFASSAAARDAVALVDGAGHIIHWTEAARAMFDVTAEQAQGKGLAQIIGAPLGLDIRPGLKDEFLVPRPAGEPLRVQLELKEGSVAGRGLLVAVISDVTNAHRLKMAAEQISAAAEFCSDAFEGYQELARDGEA